MLLAGSVGASFAQDNKRTVMVEVVDTAGQPVKYACVTFVPKSGDIVFRKADRRGRVRVRNLTGGSYRVVVKVEGYEAQKKNVVLKEKEDTVAFVMKARHER
jgi:uncharacterized membrane protein